jgi:vacuolar-type H+-ATPase subunit E/Vma4
LGSAIQIYQLASQILVVDEAEISRVLEKWRTDAGSIKAESIALADLSAAVEIFDRLKEIASQARERLIAAGAKPLQ